MARRHRRHHRHKEKKPVTFETKFYWDIIFIIILFLTVIIYLGDSTLSALAWLTDNQLFRLIMLPVSFILLIINLSTRRWFQSIFVLALVVGLGIEAWHYVPVKQNENVFERSDLLRVFTMNVGSRPYYGVLEHIVANDVDIACLEEVRVADADTLLDWAPDNGYNAHYQHLRRDAGMGVVLLTKGEITDIDSLHGMSFGTELRAFMVVTTRFDDREITIYPFQLESVDRSKGPAGWIQSWKLRQDQSRLLAHQLQRFQGDHLILAGDFNATPTDRSIRPLRRDMEDSWRMGGGKWLGATWSSDRPLFRIDAVTYKGFNGAANGSVIRLAESDHMAYQVDLVW